MPCLLCGHRVWRTDRLRYVTGREKMRSQGFRGFHDEIPRGKGPSAAFVERVRSSPSWSKHVDEAGFFRDSALALLAGNTMTVPAAGVLATLLLANAVESSTAVDHSLAAAQLRDFQQAWVGALNTAGWGRSRLRCGPIKCPSARLVLPAGGVQTQRTLR